MQLDIVYHVEGLKKIEKIDQGDWIDLNAAQNIRLKKGQYGLISLGISVLLPEGYEANVVPRSSTFKKFKIIQTNHFGVIDQSYCGNDDIWHMPVYAMEDTEIKLNDRICQFRITKKQPEITFNEVDKLHGKTRGGFGSTG